MSRQAASRGRIPDAAIADLVDRLAGEAEAVCRRYLSKGRREGAYWRVGDLGNTPGRSLYVRLKAGPKGPAGKFTDAESGEHGDLLDIIRATRGLRSFPEVVAEARAFLGLPADNGHQRQSRGHRGRKQGYVGHSRTDLASSPTEPDDVGPTLADSINAARRLFMASVPIAGTLAEVYLRRRGITALDSLTALRFHPACLYRDDIDSVSGDEPEASARSAFVAECQPSWRGPALIAAVSDADGWITGVQRTWLDEEALLSDAPLDARLGKADLPDARRSLGLLADGVVRLAPLTASAHSDELLVGEGVETVLSLRAVLPAIPLAAALSAGQLAGLTLPLRLRRLIVAQDDDLAGRAAATTLLGRARDAGLEAVLLTPDRDDFNDDLRCGGPARVLAHVRAQLAADGHADLSVAAA